MKKTKFIPLLLSVLVLSGCAPTTEEPLEVEIEETPAPVVSEYAEVTEKKCRVLFEKEVYVGSFTGTTKKDVPMEGVFTGSGLDFIGSFENGDPQTGRIAISGYHTELDGETFSGTLNGNLINGQIDGQVTFSSRTAQDVEFVYTGNWVDGCASGVATMTFEDEKSYDRIGTFVRGYFAPDGLEILQTMGTLEPCYTLSQERLDALKQYTELWEEDYTHDHFFEPVYEVDPTLSVNDMITTGELPTKWVQRYGMRVVAWQSTQFGARDIPVTVITVSLDDFYNEVLWIICPHTIDNLWRGAVFNADLFPLAKSTYTTVNGQTQSCLVALASDWYF